MARGRHSQKDYFQALGFRVEDSRLAGGGGSDWVIGLRVLAVVDLGCKACDGFVRVSGSYSPISHRN